MKCSSETASCRELLELAGDEARWREGRGGKDGRGGEGREGGGKGGGGGGGGEGEREGRGGGRGGKGEGGRSQNFPLSSADGIVIPLRYRASVATPPHPG